MLKGGGVIRAYGWMAVVLLSACAGGKPDEDSTYISMNDTVDSRKAKNGSPSNSLLAHFTGKCGAHVSPKSKNVTLYYAGSVKYHFAQGTVVGPDRDANLINYDY